MRGREWLGIRAWLRHCPPMGTFDTQGSALDLTGKLLIAMPGMMDARFARSVVCLCSHSNQGAMGLIVNRVLPDLRLPALMAHLGLVGDASALRAPDGPVHFGGPVEQGRGFVLHSTEYALGPATLQVTPAIAMTATLDVLEDMLRGRGPAQALMMLGYAGWGPGQLEQELLANGWLSVDASAALVFGTAIGTKWEAALRALGVDPLSLSGAAGRA